MGKMGYSRFMNKNLYIIPGWEDSPQQKKYKELQKNAEEKGYKVFPITVDWKKVLSEQVILIPENSVVFGFSLGAILAWLIAQKNTCKHLILGSMTPHYSFENEEIKNALIEITGEKFTKDIVDHLSKNHLAKHQTIMYGDKEEEKADILILNTDHELNSEYVKQIVNIL
jgi:hypothetical protein